jgi:hypothetical protein
MASTHNMALDVDMALSARIYFVHAGNGAATRVMHPVPPVALIPQNRRNSMRLLVLIAIAAIAIFALAAADLAGTWKGSMETQIGETEVIITIEPGAALAGKVRAGEYEAPIENGKVAGDRISFEINIDPGKVTYEGTVAGDEMKLNVTGTQGNKYTLVCKREK